MFVARKEMGKSQERNKKKFDDLQRKERVEIAPRSYVFIRKEYVRKYHPKHKVVHPSDTPYEVLSRDKKTFVARIANRT